MKEEKVTLANQPRDTRRFLRLCHREFKIQARVRPTPCLLQNVDNDVLRSGRPDVRLTPAPKARPGPSMNFQPFSREQDDILNHTIRNLCAKLGKHCDRTEKRSPSTRSNFSQVGGASVGHDKNQYGTARVNTNWADHGNFISKARNQELSDHEVLGV